MDKGIDMMEIKFGKETENQFIIQLGDGNELLNLLVKDPLDKEWTVIDFKNFQVALEKAGFFIIPKLDFPKRLNPLDLF